MSLGLGIGKKEMIWGEIFKENPPSLMFFSLQSESHVTTLLLVYEHFGSTDKNLYYLKKC